MTASVLRVPFDDGWTVAPPHGPFAALTGGRTEPVAVTLPHDAMRDVPRTPDAPGGAANAYYPSTAFTYRRRFDAPADWARRWVSFEIDGAYAHARVFVNDALVATRPYGYARFHADATPWLRPGASNELRVEVRTHLDSRWYTGAGLYRGVRLTVAGPVHVVPDGLRVTTPDIDDEWVAVEVVTRLANEDVAVRTVRVATTLTGPDGDVAATDDAPATVPPGRSVTVRRRLWVPRPRRWSTDHPDLYRATVTLTDAGEPSDEVTVRFGIRTVQVDPHRGLRLNGVPTRLRGACLHHDNGPLGAVSTHAAELRRVRRLRAAGFTAVRVAHNPASQALLDACDEAGVLVMNEAFDVWTQEKSTSDQAHDFADWWRRDLDAMVAGSVNHPSVVMYSIGNEIPELGTPHGALLARELAEHVRTLDPTRPVTCAMQTLMLVDQGDVIEQAGGLNQLMGGASADRHADDGLGHVRWINAVACSPAADAAIEEVCSVVDVAGYNYAEERYAHDAARYPLRVSVGSETFPAGIGRTWPKVTAQPRVLGDFTWTGWDYLGEAGVGAITYAEDPDAVPGFFREFPQLTAFCGDLDLVGERRPQSFYREIAYGLRTEPYLAVLRPERHGHTRVARTFWQWSDTVGSWTWPGHEGAPVTVEVYADADEVELRRDGVPLGRAPVGTAVLPYVARFETTYVPGRLEAVAYRDGVPVGRTELRSAVGDVGLALSVERFDDLAYVAVTLADADGVVWTGTDRPVSVEVTGPAVVAGMGTGRPATRARFCDTTHTTWDGRALVVVRVTGEGVVTVRATAAGCEPAEVVVG